MRDDDDVNFCALFHLLGMIGKRDFWHSSRTQWRVGKCKNTKCTVQIQVRARNLFSNPPPMIFTTVINGGNYPRAPATHFTIATKNICASAIKCVFYIMPRAINICARSLGRKFPFLGQSISDFLHLPTPPLLCNNYYH
jgi:hypothetical protein